ncbi:MAG: hypothetical protein JWO38_6216 [Gemmataceae bacterium]|nr:hypothetical protein [Gemmataceae bacterium]
MGRRILLAVVLTAVGLYPALTDGKPQQPATADELVAQLGSADFATRERASEALLARGVAALPALRKAVNHPNPEVARRVGQVLRVLEARAALEPKRVTFKPGMWTLTDAVGAINAQTGYPLTADPKTGTLPRVFGFTDLPFWAAVDRVSREFDQGLTLPMFEEKIELSTDRLRSPFVSAAGAFRVDLMRVHEDRDVDFAERGSGREPGRRDHKHTLTLNVLAEPRFILLAAGPVQVESAIDDLGEKLIPLPAEDKPDPDVIQVKDVIRRDYQFTLTPRFRRSSERSLAVRTLRGTVPVRVVVERRRVIVTETILTSEGAKFRLGGDTVTVKRAELDKDGGFYLRLGVPGDPGGEWKRRWHQRVSVEDAKGKPLKSNGSGWGSSGDEHHISVTYPAKNGPGELPPARLVVEDWVEVSHAVRFEFSDVPLP